MRAYFFSHHLKWDVGLQCLSHSIYSDHVAGLHFCLESASLRSSPLCVLQVKRAVEWNTGYESASRIRFQVTQYSFYTPLSTFKSNALIIRLSWPIEYMILTDPFQFVSNATPHRDEQSYQLKHVTKISLLENGLPCVGHAYHNYGKSKFRIIS